jgi:predicted metal-dependent hydrolase
MSTSVDNHVDGICITIRLVVDDASPTVDCELNLWACPVRTCRIVSIGHYGKRMAVQVEVRRSARRRRTVSAYREGERIVVMIPGRFTRAEEAEWVAKMVARLDTGARSASRRRGTDAALMRRAERLSESYLDGLARPATVRWVPVMRTRWASCTPVDRTIRLSARLREMPQWVQDYVLVHELAHLIEVGHTPKFWRLVERYPRTERARGYLDGVSAAADLPITDDLADDVTDGAIESDLAAGAPAD